MKCSVPRMCRSCYFVSDGFVSDGFQALFSQKTPFWRGEDLKGKRLDAPYPRARGCKLLVPGARPLVPGWCPSRGGRLLLSSAS